MPLAHFAHEDVGQIDGHDGEAEGQGEVERIHPGIPGHARHRVLLFRGWDAARAGGFGRRFGSSLLGLVVIVQPPQERPQLQPFLMEAEKSRA